MYQKQKLNYIDLLLISPMNVILTKLINYLEILCKDRMFLKRINYISKKFGKTYHIEILDIF